MNTQTATNTAITPYVINATELEKVWFTPGR